MSPAKTSGKSRGKKEVTFFDLLKQDHDKVKDIFQQIEEDEDGENREELFAGLQSELQTHIDLEEKLVYPVMQQSEELREKILEAYEEHNVAKHVLNECSNLDLEDERWEAKCSVLREIVNHHLQEEEKNLFNMAKKALEKEKIQDITNQIQQQKSGVQKEAA